MSDLARETLEVERFTHGLILIKYHQYYSNGLHLGGGFAFQDSSLAWLIEQLQMAADETLTETVRADRPPDHFTIYYGGGHRYDPVNVNIHNERDPEALGGKLYVLTGLPLETTRDLVQRLSSLI